MRNCSWNTQLWVARLLVSLVIVSVVYQCRAVDELIANLWAQLRTSWLVRHDSFEPCLSTCCFYIYISFFAVLDHFVPSAWGYRLNPSKDMSSYRTGTRNRDQFFWYVLPFLVIDYVFPRRVLEKEPPTTLRLFLEVVGAIAVYDVAFFCWHTAVHSLPSLYLGVHAKHHRSAVQRAPEAVQHTFLDGTMDVMCSIFALNALHCHSLSRAVYDLVIIFFITELHAGYDFPWQLHNVVPFGLLGGPVRHQQHHCDGRFYRQKFGTYLDYLFGSVPPATELAKEVPLVWRRQRLSKMVS
ncbi:unnamed protein product [Discosporangium mesarthrocarpum]